MGHLNGAVNIPLNRIAVSLSSIPKNQPILIVDDFGNDSPAAAKILMDKGYKDISVLFNGMDACVTYQANPQVKLSVKWIPSSDYRLLSGEAFDQLMRSGSNVALIDVRTKEQFNNQSKNSWQNIGNIKEAQNIPVSNLQQQFSSLNLPKNKAVVVYSFANSAEGFQAARILTDMGYKKVNVLLGGLFNLRWKAANLKGRSHLKDWVVNIPVENQ